MLEEAVTKANFPQKVSFYQAHLLLLTTLLERGLQGYAHSKDEQITASVLKGGKSGIAIVLPESMAQDANFYLALYKSVVSTRLVNPDPSPFKFTHRGNGHIEIELVELDIMPGPSSSFYHETEVQPLEHAITTFSKAINHAFPGSVETRFDRRKGYTLVSTENVLTKSQFSFVKFLFSPLIDDKIFDQKSLQETISSLDLGSKRLAEPSRRALENALSELTTQLLPPEVRILKLKGSPMRERVTEPDCLVKAAITICFDFFYFRLPTQDVIAHAKTMMERHFTQETGLHCLMGQYEHVSKSNEEYGAWVIFIDPKVLVDSE